MNYLKTFETYITERKIILGGGNSKSYFTNNPTGSSIPFDMIQEMFSWDIIYKSPYSFSFYSKEKSWEKTQDRTIRLSDHWNFTTKNSDAIHCQTTEPIENNVYWAFGVYDEKTGKYTITSKQKALVNSKDRQENIVKIKNFLKENFKEILTDKANYNIALQNQVNTKGLKIKVTNGLVYDMDGEFLYKINEPIIGVASKIGKVIILDIDGKNFIIKGRSNTKKYKYEALEEIQQ